MTGFEKGPIPNDTTARRCQRFVLKMLMGISGQYDFRAGQAGNEESRNVFASLRYAASVLIFAPEEIFHNPISILIA